MGSFIYRHSLFLTSLGLLVLSCQLMSVSIENADFPRFGARFLHAGLAPIQEVHHKSVSSVTHVWDRYVWLLGVEQERDELARRIKVLEGQNSRLLEFEHENQRLQKLLDYRAQTGLSGVTATVVGRDHSNWVRTITIDRGRDDGLASGLPVVDGEALVGQTTVVTAKHAKVLLLTDNSSAIDVLIQRSRGTGIVEGASGRALRMRYVLKEVSVRPGDRVIASGLGGVFPKGALIGVVLRVTTPTHGLFHDVVVEPNVDFGRLENVLVVTNAEAVTPAPEEGS